MALFGSKKKTEKEAEPQKAPKAEKAVVKDIRATKIEKKKVVKAEKVKSASRDVVFDPTIILAPRVTEKASMQAEIANVYVFEVTKNANKTSIAQAIKGLFKVTPTKVRIATNPSKAVFTRGKWGRKGGVKKAYVHLAKGDKIEIV